MIWTLNYWMMQIMRDKYIVAADILHEAQRKVIQKNICCCSNDYDYDYDNYDEITTTVQ